MKSREVTLGYQPLISAGVAVTDQSQLVKIKFHDPDVQSKGWMLMLAVISNKHCYSMFLKSYHLMEDM